MAPSVPMKRAATTVCLVGLLTLMAPGVGFAHWDRYGGWGRHGWHDGWHRGWHDGWGFRGGIVIGPPAIYYPPPRFYYAPPPAYYYAPPPAYYYAPPPAYYGWQYYPRY